MNNPAPPLNKSVAVTLDGSGNGSVGLGPDASKGPPTWIVNTVLWKSSRIGQSPIPRIVVSLEGVDQALSYDGSFGSGSGSVTVTRGQQLIATWTGGQSGDICTFTISGTVGN